MLRSRSNTLKRCQYFGESLMVVEALYPMFESNISVPEDIKTFMACSILHGILWEGNVAHNCVELGLLGWPNLRVFGKGVSEALLAGVGGLV